MDVRFIAATNKDLAAALREKTFREDLYYRIRGAVIELPPLRHRREDIPLLDQPHDRRASAEKLGKKIEGIDADARNALVAFHWPGNVRELEQTVESMIALARELAADTGRRAGVYLGGGRAVRPTACPPPPSFPLSQTAAAGGGTRRSRWRA